MKITIRKNTLINTFEKKLGLGKGAIRNPDGSKPRPDKQLVTLIKDYQRSRESHRKYRKKNNKVGPNQKNTSNANKL